MKAKGPTYKFKMYCNHGNRELHKTIDASPDLDPIEMDRDHKATLNIYMERLVRFYLKSL